MLRTSQISHENIIYRLTSPRSPVGDSNRFRVSGSPAGFSLLELMMVVLIAMVAAGIAVPTYLSISYSIRLKSAATDISAFMQRARILAARSNATYAIAYTTVSGAGEACIDENLNGACDAGEPLLTFKSTVTLAPSAPTGTLGTPTPYVLVGDTSGTTYTNGTTLAYSPRGLPCAYVSSVCATPAAGYFVYYLQDQRPASIGWAAVVVSRSGRTKTVTWNGTAWQ